MLNGGREERWSAVVCDRGALPAPTPPLSLSFVSCVRTQRHHPVALDRQLGVICCLPVSDLPSVPVTAVPSQVTVSSPLDGRSFSIFLSFLPVGLCAAQTQTALTLTGGSVAPGCWRSRQVAPGGQLATLCKELLVVLSAGWRKGL